MRQRRFEEMHYKASGPRNYNPEHPSILEGRTRFPSTVTTGSLRLLKSGMHSRKIGRKVAKGRWRGMPIFTLTLEERKTCPRSCSYWGDCYGNNMHWSQRHVHGEFLEQQLERELKCFQYEYPDGFVVRLHVLGDFYSDSYVCSWYHLMLNLPALHVFGYTAWGPDTQRGKIISALHYRFPERWWVRHSDADKATWLSTGESGIICPMQQSKTDCCATCGLCWAVKKPIRFLPH